MHLRPDRTKYFEVFADDTTGEPRQVVDRTVSSSTAAAPWHNLA